MIPQLPYTSHFASIRGEDYHYWDVGTGDPLLMIHGNPTWAYYYRHLIARFSSCYRCVAPDHLGCGLSAKPGLDSYPFTLQARIDDLEAFVKQLQLPPVTLVVHDWGGAIGLGWALRQPHLVKRLVILNTAAFCLPNWKKLPWSLRLVRNTFLGPGLILGLNAFTLSALATACCQARLSAAQRRMYLYPCRQRHGRLAQLQFVRDIPLQPGDRSYAEIARIEKGLQQFRDIPALLVWGEKDYVFDTDYRDIWQRFLPQASCLSLPRAGHWLLEDDPQAVGDAMAGFFQAG